MSITKVDKKDFSKFPILLIINISDEINLNFLYFIKTLRQFTDEKDSKERDELGIGTNINKNDDEADKINPKVLVHIVFNYIFDYIYSFSS